MTAKREDNYETALIDFEPNKIYYLINKIRFSTIDGPRVRLDRLDDKEAKILFENGCKFYVLTNTDLKLNNNEFNSIKDNYYEFVDLKSAFSTTSLVPLDRKEIITRISTDDSERLTSENILIDNFTNKYNKLLISDIMIGNDLLGTLDNEDKDNASKFLPEMSSLITNGVAEYLNGKKIINVIKNSKPNKDDRVLILELEINKINFGNRVVKFLFAFSTGDAQAYIKVRGRLIDFVTKKKLLHLKKEKLELRVSQAGRIIR